MTVEQPVLSNTSSEATSHARIAPFIFRIKFYAPTSALLSKYFGTVFQAVYILSGGSRPGLEHLSDFQS